MGFFIFYFCFSLSDVITCAFALITLFLLSSAKEEHCVPEVSGRAAAVGNSRWVTLQLSSCSVWVVNSWFKKNSLGQWYRFAVWECVCACEGDTHLLPRPTAKPSFFLATVVAVFIQIGLFLFFGPTWFHSSTPFTSYKLTHSFAPFVVLSWLQRKRLWSAWELMTSQALQVIQRSAFGIKMNNFSNKTEVIRHGCQK